MPTCSGLSLILVLSGSPRTNLKFPSDRLLFDVQFQQNYGRTVESPARGGPVSSWLLFRHFKLSWACSDMTGFYMLWLKVMLPFFPLIHHYPGCCHLV